MKRFKQILILTVAVTLMSFMVDKPIKVEKLTIKEIDNSVAKVGDKLYACKYELSNGIYLQFLQSLQTEGKTELIKTATLDTNNWVDKLAYNAPYKDYYYRHPAYANYPVVNVSWEAANLFCKWLTDFYNSDANRKYKKVVFRLPSAAEWETAARGGDNSYIYSWGYPLLQNGLWAANYKHIGDEFITYDTLKKQIVVDRSIDGPAFQLNNAADITAPVDSYKPNGFGIYNTCGNVAEMINEKGIACGGGWRSTGGDIRIASRMRYTKSASDIGFRYFMEIMEE